MSSTADALGVVALYAAPVLLVGVTFAQVVRLYVGNAVARRPDPHLGRKLAAHGLGSLAVVLLLVGATISVLDLADWVAAPLAAAQQAKAQGLPPPAPGPTRSWLSGEQRTAAGLLTAGLFYLVVCEAFLRLATNDRQFPKVRRAAAGTRFVGCGGACMALTTYGSCAAFAADTPGPKELAQVAGLAGVWFPAAGLHLLLMLRPKGPPAAGDD